MMSASLPINLETTPAFKDYVSNVKKQLVKMKQNSDNKRQGTRPQVARKSTSWHRPYKLYCIEPTAASPTPVGDGTIVNSISLLSSICEGENGKENGSDEKNGEKERARSDGVNSPVDDHHNRQAISNSPLHIQHSPKGLTEDEEKEKEDEEDEQENQEEEEDVCKQISRVISMAASEASTSEIIDTGDKTTSISSLASEFDKSNDLDNEHNVKIEVEEPTQNEESSSSSVNQHFNQHTSSDKKIHHNHEFSNSQENKEEDLSKQSCKDISNSMETVTLSTPSEKTETNDSTLSVPFEPVVDIKQQRDQDKKPEEAEKFKRKLSNDNTEHVSKEKTIRNCSPPPESFKEEDKPC